MRISVVVPAFNSEKQLRILLHCLNHNEVAPADSLQVVIVDDGSTDATSDVVTGFAAKFDLRYVFVPRTDKSCRAAARNAGIAVADGDLVIMLDADQVVGTTFVQEHAGYHSLRDDLVVVGPRTELGDGSYDEEVLAQRFTLKALPPTGFRDVREPVLDQFSWNLNQMSSCWQQMFTYNVSVRRAHLDAVGGFDEAYIGWGLEDSDLGFRLRQQGLAFAFNAMAVSYHQSVHGVDEDLYRQWHQNFLYMTGKFSTPEVASLAIIGRVLNPADGKIGWVDGMRRFEYANRALVGRLPRQMSFELIEFAGPDASGTLKHIGERVLESDVIVIDNTPNAALSGPVQCIDTSRELLYFYRPSRQLRDDIMQRYAVSI